MLKRNILAVVPSKAWIRSVVKTILFNLLRMTMQTKPLNMYALKITDCVPDLPNMNSQTKQNHFTLFYSAFRQPMEHAERMAPINMRSSLRLHTSFCLADLTNTSLKVKLGMKPMEIRGFATN